MRIALSISPHGRAFVQATPEDAPGDEAAARRIAAAFEQGTPQGLLYLATAQLTAALPPSLAFARDLAHSYLSALCRRGSEVEAAPVPPPVEQLTTLAEQAPPMWGLEYLTGDVLASWWAELDDLVRAESAAAGGLQPYLQAKNPLWRLVGRVTFHLAENKRDPQYPFAFLAAYASRVSTQGRVQHQPLGKALEEYAKAKDRPTLVSLLTPVHRASERCAWVAELVESGEVFHPLAWGPQEAFQFLKDIPALEESGLIVRVPDWWKANRPPRPVVSVKIGDRVKSKLGAEALLDFSVRVTLDGQPLSEQDLRAVLESNGGLVPLRGKWVEVDREKLAEALQHWKQVEREARGGGISFYEGMRLLSGAPIPGDVAAAAPPAAREWVGITAGEALDETLRALRDPEATRDAAPPGLRAELRPYQRAGVHWLRFMTRLGLGACLADDMGLGKTVQVIALLLHLRQERSGADAAEPSLLIVPASLIANWKAEIARFAPQLSIFIAHPSERLDAERGEPPREGCDLVITTYGMLPRLPWARERKWSLAILDEAQAIKNSGTRQARGVKELQAAGRVALTGTPVENRLSDLWSLFDFLNPGLLGGPKAFASLTKQMASREHNSYGPLRALVKPYILRRLKTDKRVIADLPDKTELTAFCGLSRQQVALYEHAVKDLAESLKQTDGIQRRGVVLASLMRLKQICNHPSQLLDDGRWEPKESGKFDRLATLCGEISERQEKALVFTQFREMTVPLAEFLATVFGRPGLVLHGQTPVGKRRELVDGFQRDDGPPFFVLSLKAGGTGLNLTEASHVIHFDRWWNPAVENQATDRAFRIGQKRNVLVHKFVCRGTVEERIDELIAQKTGLSRELLDEGAEVLLTEMNNEQLLKFVSLDVRQAIES